MKRPSTTHLGLSLFLCAAFVFVAFLLSAALSPLHADQHFDPEKARELVEQLGAPKYSERQLAGTALLKMGIDVLPILNEGTEHPDREVRYRSAQLLDIVREADFTRRLAAFEASVNDNEDFGLPLWLRFRNLVGAGPETRRIFVEMQRAESSLLRAAGDSDEKTKALVADRMQEMQKQLQFQPRGLPIGSTAALLFVSGNEKVQTPDQHGWLIYNYVLQQPFNDQLRDGPRREPLRKLLGNWIRHNTSSAIAYQSMMVAMQFDLTEGLIPAEKMLSQAGQAPQVRQYAVLTVARFGDVNWTTKLAPLLEDTGVCMQFQNNNMNYTTQVRDVALAATIHLYKLDPKTFGFDNIRTNPQYGFDPASLGFKSDDDRTAAKKKWDEFRAKGEKK